MRFRDAVYYGKPRETAVIKGDNLEVPVAAGYPFGVGIEIEVEGVQFNIGHTYKPWTLTKDGSLRNNGYEFVSPYLKVNQVKGALEILNMFLTQCEPQHVFSNRASVHVHLDCRNFTLEDLTKLLLVYPSVEPLLFAFSGKDRFNSKFCVPSTMSLDGGLYQRLLSCNEPNKFWGDLKNDVSNRFGQHYSAMNVDNLIQGQDAHGNSPKGTIEFRHMEGNCDVERILTWVRILESLKIYAVSTPKETILNWITTINISSYYKEYLTEIFGPLAETLLDKLPLQAAHREISRSVSIIKAGLCLPPKIPGVGFLSTPLAKRLQGVVFKNDLGEPPKAKENAQREEYDDPPYDPGIEEYEARRV